MLGRYFFDLRQKNELQSIFWLKEIYDRGFTNMEKSHQKVLMEMRRTHKRELDQLRVEKDQLLAEETKATQAGELNCILEK